MSVALRNARSTKSSAQKGWETRRRREAEEEAARQARSRAAKRAWHLRRAAAAALHEKRSRAAKKAAETRRANQAAREFQRQKRAETARRAWREKTELGPIELKIRREAREAERERIRYEKAERKAILRAERDQEKILQKQRQSEIQKVYKQNNRDMLQSMRQKNKMALKFFADRMEAIEGRKILAKKGIPDSALYGVDINNPIAVQSLAAALGVTAHSVYGMRLSPAATGGADSGILQTGTF